MRQKVKHIANILRRSILSNHKEEWQKWYNFYNNQQDEVSQYRARCIRGLLENTTYDYVEVSKPVEIPL